MGLISRVSSRTYRKSDIMSMNVRTRKYMTNRLLNRKQMIVDISHGEDATPSAKKVRESLAKMYKSTPDCVIVYGMQTKFGGGSTSGFANIYDSLDYLKKNEVRFRQVRAGIVEDREEGASPATTAQEPTKEGQGYRQVQGRFLWQEVNRVITIFALYLKFLSSH